MKKSDQFSPCYYCGNLTGSIEKLEVFNKKYKLPCCSDECKAKVAEYAEWDNKNRLKSYLLLTIFVVFNLFSIGFNWTFRWHYLALTGIGVVLYLYPLILFRQTSYMKFGIKKTLNILRAFAILIILASLFFLIFSS